MIRGNLIGRGYLPKELPPLFSSGLLDASIDLDGPLSLEKSPRPGAGLNARPTSHNLARPGNLRRRLQIPNPFSYYELATAIEENWKPIEAQLDRSSITVSRPTEDPQGVRAFVPASRGLDLMEHRAKVRATAKFILKTDIARFYPSIYTHSISWAVDGKAVAKKKRRGGLANELDRIVRQGQDGQTVGIPIGPDSSLIIAEVVAAAIDSMLQDKGFSGIRFMDDYEFGFASRFEAEQALASIEEVLANFELGINTRKTTVLELPAELDYPWRRSLAELEVTDGSIISKQRSVAFFDRLFRLARDHKDQPVISYGVSMLRRVEFEEDSWPFARDLLCQCAGVEPSSMPSFHQILLAREHLDLGDAVTTTVNQVLTRHSALGHGSEVAWALWTAMRFGISVGQEATRMLARSEDPVVRVMALRAREEGVFDTDDFEQWADSVTLEALYDEQWLFAFEAAMRGWFTLDADPLKDDANFSQLQKRSITFLLSLDEVAEREDAQESDYP